MITVGWTIYRDRFWDHLVRFCGKASDLFGIAARREVSNPIDMAVVNFPPSSLYPAQRLSENHAGPFVFRDRQEKHFTANFVIKVGGVDCGLVAHSIE